MDLGNDLKKIDNDPRYISHPWLILDRSTDLETYMKLGNRTYTVRVLAADRKDSLGPEHSAGCSSHPQRKRG